MVCILLLEILDSKIIHTKTELALEGSVRPKTDCKRNRIVTVAIEMFDQFLISDDSSLLETIHAFVDLNINIAIRINEGIYHVECSDFWRKLLGMNAHILGTCHGCGEEEVFQVHSHETSSQMGILDGAVE